MYSMVLLAAMTAGTADAPAFHGGFGSGSGGSFYNTCTLDNCHPLRYGSVGPRSPGCGDSWFHHSRPMGGYCGCGGYGAVYSGYSYGCGSCGGCHSYGCWGGCNGWQYPIYSGSCTGASCYGSCFGHAYGQTDTYHPGVGAGYAGFGANGNYGAYGLMPSTSEPNIYSTPSMTPYPSLIPPAMGATNPMGTLPPIINPMLVPSNPPTLSNPLTPPTPGFSGGFSGTPVPSLSPDPYGPLIDPKLSPEPKGSVAPMISPKNVSMSRIGTIVVEVPETARVYIDGTLMAATSSVRSFRTPALSADEDFFYTIRVEMEREGRTVEQTKKVYVRAGERSSANFFDAKVERPRVALDR